MSGKTPKIEEMLENLTTDADQVQALINMARRKFPADATFQKQLDESQHQLDQKSEHIRELELAASIAEK